MKIVHIITRLILGGAQQNTVISSAAQVKAGHQVWLVYGPIYGPEGSLLADAKKTGAELVQMMTLRRPILPLHDWLAFRAMRKLIQRVRPDVVHTHSSKAGILGRAAAWRERVPAVIHTIHGLPFHERQSRMVYQAYVRLERWAALRCHKLLGVTQAMCDAFLRLGIGRPEQFERVPSGVDCSLFEPLSGERAQVRSALNISPEASVVGLLGRYDRLKGQDDLLDILPQLKARHPGVKLLLVGDGWHRPQLEERIQREGFGGQVILTGLIPPERVPAYLAAMDVNTLPSYQEGQPRTLVQALLCGCGIVGYDAGGIPEICVHEKTGLLVKTGDRAALFEAISDLLAHRDKRARLVQQGQQHARENFDAGIMVRRLEEIYRQVLKPH